MDCKKHVSSNSTFVKVNESSMYRDMGLAPAQSFADDCRIFCISSLYFFHIQVLERSEKCLLLVGRKLWILL